MNSITLNVTLPENLYSRLISFVKDMTQESSSDFIIEAIEQRLQTEKERILQQLTEGYQATRNEDLLLAKDFEHADFEIVKQ